ncbi:MAG: hypothetical protein PVJ36_05235 [Nitrospirota bacterium]
MERARGRGSIQCVDRPEAAAGDLLERFPLLAVAEKPQGQA